MIFVHVPEYYNFDVEELNQMWLEKFVSRKKFWLGERCQLVFFASELDMISEFLFYLFTHVDMFMGFNSSGFDLPFLITRCNFLNEGGQIAAIHRPFFTSITSLGFTIPANPTHKLFIRNTSNGYSSTFFVLCKTCKKNKRDVKLNITTANDQNIVPCAECRCSQIIDMRELITKRESTRSMSDTLVSLYSTLDLLPISYPLVLSRPSAFTLTS